MTPISLLLYKLSDTLLILFFISVAILCAYHLLAFIVILIQKNKGRDRQPVQEGVSVVIYYHNQKRLLFKILPLLVQQNHPDFEIIIIDNKSDDENYLYQHYFENYSKNIKIVRINTTPNIIDTQKYAVTLAVKAAQHDILLFTDASCTIISRNWLSSMTSPFRNEKTQIVTGQYIDNSISLFKGFINRFAIFSKIIKNLVTSYFFRPIAADICNFAFRKSFFLETGGYGKYQNIKRGEASLFVNKFGSTKNATTHFSRAGLIIKNQKSNTSSVLQQEIYVERFFNFFQKTWGRTLFLAKLMVWLITAGHVYIAFDVGYVIPSLNLIIIGITVYLLALIQNFFIITQMLQIRNKVAFFLLPLVDIMYVLYSLIIYIKVALLFGSKSK